jgi:hypothetical protein
VGGLWIAVDRLWKEWQSAFCKRLSLILKLLLLHKMVTAGYSGTPLLKKLGIKPEMKLLLINQPDNYYKLVEKNLNKQLIKKNETPDVVHLFVKDFKEFEKETYQLKKVIAKNRSISIWVSWYKKSAKISTDITEDVIRNYALANGLVDIKVCAVSDIWSGLKLVVPVAKR